MRLVDSYGEFKLACFKEAFRLCAYNDKKNIGILA